MRSTRANYENLGDMTGLEFIRAIVSKRPMVNCAAISSLASEDFHEASEGLGILMQLPVINIFKYTEVYRLQLLQPLTIAPLHTNGPASVSPLSTFHFQGQSIRQVSYYTLLSGFRLP